MELLIIALFCVSLIICLVAGAAIYYAMVIGLAMFIIYGLIKGHSFKSLVSSAFDGFKTVLNMLILFVIIGMLTATWRACGTIPVIVCYAAPLIKPSVVLLVTFILCSGVSFLIGTSFGTTATMGVICASVASSMGVNPAFVGGAVLSGGYFGDRCSPVSGITHLNAEITKSDIYTNMKNMVKTAAIPFAASCGVYLLLGLGTSKGSDLPDFTKLFSQEFNLGIILVIPAVLVLGLSLARVNSKIAMLISLAAAFVQAIAIQHHAIPHLLKYMVFGFTAAEESLAPMINGGGIQSMASSLIMVSIAGMYSGIFKETGMLNNVSGLIKTLSEKTTRFVALAVTALLTSFIVCSQVLSILLTKQLCEDLYEDEKDMAIDLADTATVIAPLVPWNIAGGVPLQMVGAPITGVLFAVYLWLLPICGIIRSFVAKKHA